MNDGYELHFGDCMDLMRSLEPNSVDSIVCDPPYGLSPDGRVRTWEELAAMREAGRGPKGGYMGQEWDAGIPGVGWAQECFRVLKPGGHLIAFSSTRTVHRLTVAVEDGGFQIRDQLGWIYTAGMPKSLQLERHLARTGAEQSLVDRWTGWGTGLKPCIEPAVFARKPPEGTLVANALKWGVGALNIDGCRMKIGDPSFFGDTNAETEVPPSGRWPGNLYMCPKAQRGERERGCDNLEATPERNGRWVEDPDGGGMVYKKNAFSPNMTFRNNHPTVKPVRLMRWCARLVTPPGGTVLDPFAGSGTMGIAAVLEGFRYIGAELSPDFHHLASERIKHAVANPLHWVQTAPGVPRSTQPIIHAAEQISMF